MRPSMRPLPPHPEARNDAGYEIGFTGVHDPRPERLRLEAANLSGLAAQFPNLTGGIIDDASNMFGLSGYDAAGPAGIRTALRSGDRPLDRWDVVCAKPVGLPEWVRDFLRRH